MTSTTIFHLVRQGRAAELCMNSSGSIQYAVFIDGENAEPYLALAGNKYPELLRSTFEATKEITKFF